MTKIIHREMGITEQEFLRLLPSALAGRSWRRSGDSVLVQDGTRSLRISLTALSPRTLAALELPVTRIDIEAAGFSEAGLERFIRGFDLAYQKGGG